MSLGKEVLNLAAVSVLWKWKRYPVNLFWIAKTSLREIVALRTRSSAVLSQNELRVCGLGIKTFLALSWGRGGGRLNGCQGGEQQTLVSREANMFMK